MNFLDSSVESGGRPIPPIKPQAGWLSNYNHVLSASRNTKGGW